jgi:hypothetical protein
MGLFDRLFGSREEPQTKLGSFLSGLSERAIQERVRSEKNIELRAPLAVSLIVLQSSGRFTTDLFRALRSSKVPGSASTSGAERFDATVYETAAFAHYALMAEGLRASVEADDEDDEAWDEDDPDNTGGAKRPSDPYFELARDACHVSGMFLNALVSFELNKKRFVTRPLAYSTRARRQSMVHVFSAILIETIESGSLATLTSKSVSLDLGLSVLVPAHAHAFATSMLPAFQEILHNAVDKAAELGFE